MVTGKEIFGEGLGRLQLGAGPAGPQAGQAGGGKGIHHPGGQGCLGADHGHGHLQTLGNGAQPVDILDTHIDIAHPRLEGRACIARGHMHMVDPRRAGQPPGKRMLAPTAADHQNIHLPSRFRGPLISGENAACR